MHAMLSWDDIMGIPHYLHDGYYESPVDNKLAQGSRTLVAARRTKK